MTQIRGLLFDKDGTLFDFHASWSAVLLQTLDLLAHDGAEADSMARAVGYDPDTGRFMPGAPIVAGSLEQSAEIWARFRPDLGVARIVEVANSVAHRAVAAGALVPAVPDLARFLGDLRRAGFVLGVATHDAEDAAIDQLSRVGALDHFAMVIGADSGHGLKPGPGMALAFMNQTGLRPAEVAMIGDSVHDLGVKASAGLALAIGVLTGPAGDQDLAPHADHVVRSIADLPQVLPPVVGRAPGPG